MTLFSKIIAGTIPCHKIYEDELFFAFLDIAPVSIGHVLLIPKIEVDYIFDLNDDLLSKLVVVAKHIAQAIEKAIPCKRIGVMVIGLEVPHTHIHLVPIHNEGDLNLSKPKLIQTSEQLKATAQKIRAAFLS